MSLHLGARRMSPRRSLDTGEITRRFIYKMQLSWTSFTGRLPLIVEITGRRCLSVVCVRCVRCAYTWRTFINVDARIRRGIKRARFREGMQPRIKRVRTFSRFILSSLLCDEISYSTLSQYLL